MTPTCADCKSRPVCRIIARYPAQQAGCSLWEPAPAPEAENPVAAAKRGRTGPRVPKPAPDPTWWTGREPGRGGLQEAVEKMCYQMGYWPRHNNLILLPKEQRDRAIVPQKGWLIHCRWCQGNDFILDVLLLSPSRRSYLEMEGKTATGKLSPMQQALCDLDGCRVFRSVAEAEAILNEWESEGGAK